VHGGTNRALAHVKLPETARRGGVRARDGDGKKIGFDQLEMPPMDMTGGTNALVLRRMNRRWKIEASVEPSVQLSSW
jgi:hypothetical protein